MANDSVRSTRARAEGEATYELGGAGKTGLCMRHLKPGGGREGMVIAFVKDAQVGQGELGDYLCKKHLKNYIRTAP